MSVFKKLKDVLFDVEDETELPVIEKTKPVVDNNPIKEIKMPKEDVIEKNTFKEPSFNFPLDFDDEEKEKPKKRERENYFDDDFERKDYDVKPAPVVKKKEVPEFNFNYTKTRRDEKKSFKLSPVISPVYGILDQNYTKDDVIVKSDVGVKAPNIDDVRKKAFEKLNAIKENYKKEEPVVREKEISENVQVQRRTTVRSNPVDDDELFNDDYDYNRNDKRRENRAVPKDEESSLENDLFNLIDSMYEDNDEEGDNYE